MLEHAGIVEANDRGGLRQPTPRQNGIHVVVRRRPHPEPLQDRLDAPARFIDGHHRTAADLGAQRGIGGLRPPRRAVHRLHHAAARDRQPEPVAQQGGNLAVGQAVALIEQHGERHGLRAEVHRGGAERVGGLQRMTALHAPAAVRALADLNAEGAHHRTWTVSLPVLRLNAEAADRRAVGQRAGSATSNVSST